LCITILVDKAELVELVAIFARMSMNENVTRSGMKLPTGNASVLQLGGDGIYDIAHLCSVGFAFPLRV
jgi:hypothetical protein